MKEQIVLSVAVSLFVTVLSLFGLGRLGLAETLIRTQERPSAALRIAVVDLEKVSTEAARSAAGLPSGQSALMRYEEVLMKVSQQLREQGFLVMPRSVLLGVPNNVEAIEDVTPLYVEALQKN